MSQLLVENVNATVSQWIASNASILRRVPRYRYRNISVSLIGPPLHDGDTQVFFTCLYVAVFIAGCIGNALTLVVVKKTRDLQSNTNFFLCNLAVSDMLLLVSGLPFDLIYMWRTYPAIAGSWHCILKGQLSETASNVSILTILFLTLERWVAICRPLHLCVYFNRDRIFTYVLSIWLVAGTAALMLSAQFGVVAYQIPNSSIVQEHVTQCDVVPSRRVPYVFETTSMLFFVLPMTIIIGAYGLIVAELNRCPGRIPDSSRKSSMGTASENGPQLKARFLVVVMLIIVAGLFFLCFLPLHVQRLMATYDDNHASSEGENSHFSRVWFTVSGLMHYVSAATNPIIYNAMSRRFRTACKHLLCSICSKYFSDEKAKNRIVQKREDVPMAKPVSAPIVEVKSTSDTNSLKQRFIIMIFGRQSEYETATSHRRYNALNGPLEELMNGDQNIL